MKNRANIQTSDGFTMKTSHGKEVTFLVATSDSGNFAFSAPDFVYFFKSNGSSLVSSPSTRGHQ